MNNGKVYDGCPKNAKIRLLFLDHEETYLFAYELDIQLWQGWVILLARGPYKFFWALWAAPSSCVGPSSWDPHSYYLINKLYLTVTFFLIKFGDSTGRIWPEGRTLPTP